jgi:flagellin-specific chaperone FliS
LYEFCRKSLLSGYKEKNYEKISEILPVIDNILDGWKGIK